uniref:Cyclin-dependent kinase 21 n=1 Tax=Oncorhynchus mykiss TaxID=8022 RepID=A0A8K9UK65_ONCMY
MNYEILAEIGEGAYGKVYKAREVRDQQRLVAVKKLNIPGHTESGIPAFMIREVALLRKIEYFNHPNIVKLLDVSAGLKNRSLDLTLVFEYIDQDLSTFLTTVPSTGLSLDKIKDVMVQLLQGLDFLHTNMLVHRDLKPENVLVSSRGEVKIADFGLARIYTYHIALTPCVSLQIQPDQSHLSFQSPLPPFPSVRLRTHNLAGCGEDGGELGQRLISLGLICWAPMGCDS